MQSAAAAQSQTPPSGADTGTACGATSAATTAGNLRVSVVRPARSVSQPLRWKQRVASDRHAAATGPRGCRSPRSRSAASCKAAALSSPWSRGPTTRPTSFIRATSSSTARSRSVIAQGLIVIQEVNDPLSLVKQRKFASCCERSRTARNDCDPVSCTLHNGRRGRVRCSMRRTGRSARTPPCPPCGSRPSARRSTARAPRSSSKPASRRRAVASRPDPLTPRCSTSAMSARKACANSVAANAKSPHRVGRD